MSGNFDWQTEDELRAKQQTIWDDGPEETPPARPSRRIPWRLLAVITVLLAGVGLTVWWRVQVRIDATLQALRNDVASSYNLVQLAVLERDEELFRSVLSGRDPIWTDSQLQLFNAGLLIDRTPLGLSATTDSLPHTLPIPFDEPSDSSPAAIDFSPDLNQATVTTVQPFAITTLDGTPDTVFLEQTTVLRRGTQRWLLAPPEGEFWGELRLVESGRVVVEYPARDEAVAVRLADDLAAAVDQLCSTLADMDCGKVSVSLRLVAYADVLATLAGSDAGRQTLLESIQRGEPLILPAPTLLGRPLAGTAEEDAGYQALLNAYLTPVLQTAVAKSAGWTCCQQGALFEVLFERQMAELGYGVWPVNPANYQQILAGTRLSDLGYVWRSNSSASMSVEDRDRLRVTVDFLLRAFPDLSPGRMQQLLPIAPNLEEWLSEALINSEDKGGNAWILNSLDQAWWMLAMQGTLDGGDPPVPLPDESLYLACTAEEGTQRPGPASVYRYDVNSDEWEPMLSVDGFIWMSPLPTPDTLLMQEFVLSEETWQTNLWREQQREPLYRTETGFSISFGETDPDGRYLVTYAWEPEQEQTNALLLDLATCDDGCDYSQLYGLPIWSPDGRRAIYSGDQATLPDNTLITNERIIIFDPGERFYERLLTLGPAPTLDSAGPQQPVGTGYGPFWLDEQTFGYIQVIRDGTPGPAVDEQIVIATVDDTAPQPILSSADLFEFLPEGQDAARVTLAYVAPHPIDRELMFIVAVDEVQKMAFVFSYDLSTRQPALRVEVRYDLNHSFSFSPDGRYLIVTGRDRGSVGPADNSGILYLHNIAANTTVPFAIRLPFFLSSVTYDWTDDSNWLVLALDDNLVALVAPDYDYVRPIVHPYGTCTSVAWLQE
jgi:hypothetical protein